MSLHRFILLASRGETLPVHGAGDSVRSYLYVEDVAEAFLCVLHQGVTGVAVTSVLIFASCFVFRQFGIPDRPPGLFALFTCLPSQKPPQ